MKRDLKKVLGDLEAYKPERQLKVEREGIWPATKALLDAYEKCLGSGLASHGRWTSESETEKCLEQITNTGVDEIQPKIISQFAQSVIAYDGENNFCNATGFFLNALIQKSYKQGNNNFKLDLRQAKPINYLGDKFFGKKRRRLRVSVIGNLGDYCWDNSIYCTTKIQGNVADSFARKVGFSRFSITGGLKNECFAQAYNSKIEIGGETGTYCGNYADRCTVTMNGRPGWRFGAGAKNTKFRSVSEEVIWKIKQHASRGCTFFLIVDGKDKLVGKK